MPKLYNLIVTLLLATTIAHAQERTVTILRGIVLDDSTGEVLSFATIAGPRHAVNTMSNEEGRFIIKLGDAAAYDSLTITHVGYHPANLPITASKDKDLVIRLRRRPIQLLEAVVSGASPLEIIRKAIAKIPENYPASPYLLSGFYRLTSRAEDRIVELSEAVFNIYGSDYTTKSQQFRLVKSRLDKDWNAFGWNGMTMIKRPEGMINVDLVGRIGQSEVFGEKEEPEHVFTYRGIVDYEGRAAYEIAFDQRPEVQKADHRGIILIDSQSLAFLSITQTLSPLGLRYWHIKSRLDQAALDREKMQHQAYSDSVTVTYQRYGGRYYLHHYYRLAVIRLSGGNHETIDLNPMVNETNYLVTRVDTNNVQPFAERDLMVRNGTIEFRAGARTPASDRFWENYNLIEASFDVDSAAAVIRQRNRIRR